MHPAPSVILFTVLSGLGFGLLAMFGLGVATPTGLGALVGWGLGYALAMSGLVASTFHLGNPQRALRAFTQWRTSWLSREAWFAVAALLALAPVAFAAVGGGGLRWLGVLGALLCLAAILSTAMIYAQLRTVPRWNHWTTVAQFFAFALAGGAILAPAKWLAVLLLAVLGAAKLYYWRSGDTRFVERGHTLATATGLGGIGDVRSFAPPHTGPNYLTTEMIHVVGRKHARTLRVVAFTFAVFLPLILLALAPEGPGAAVPAAVLHLLGALASRWLFFAEAEHVVGLYYGAR
jgi:DMSO reductase anchor subunit